LLDQLAMTHHRHPVGDLRHNPEIMGDEQNAGAAPLLQFADELEDLLLRRDIERGGRLVRDQQGRIEHQSRRDHHTLALTA
jgi:hypothetical protein